MSEHAGSEQEQKSAEKKPHWWQTPRAKRVIELSIDDLVL